LRRKVKEEHVALRGEARNLGELGGKADAFGEASLRLKGGVHSAGGWIVVCVIGGASDVDVPMEALYLGEHLMMCANAEEGGEAAALLAALTRPEDVGRAVRVCERCICFFSTHTLTEALSRKPLQQQDCCFPPHRALDFRSTHVEELLGTVLYIMIVKQQT
jgi:hypothetical protein